MEGLWDGFINLGASVVQLLWVFSLRNLLIITNTSSVSSVKSQLFMISVSISSSFMAFKISSLRLRGIMIGRHFHANIKVQTAMCKDNNNSKSKAATYVKFDIYIK